MCYSLSVVIRDFDCIIRTLLNLLLFVAEMGTVWFTNQTGPDQTDLGSGSVRFIKFRLGSVRFGSLFLKFLSISVRFKF